MDASVEKRLNALETGLKQLRKLREEDAGVWGEIFVTTVTSEMLQNLIGSGMKNEGLANWYQSRTQASRVQGMAIECGMGDTQDDIEKFAQLADFLIVESNTEVPSLSRVVLRERVLQALYLLDKYPETLKKKCLSQHFVLEKFWDRI